MFETLDTMIALVVVFLILSMVHKFVSEAAILRAKVGDTGRVYSLALARRSGTTS